MIGTLFVTLVIESAVVLGYALWRRKSFQPIFVTSICGNVITQSFLWIVLRIFFRSYLLTLLVAETLIWIGEGFLLYFISLNKLNFKEAMSLSLTMNLLSFGVGWFLPI